MLDEQHLAMADLGGNPEAWAELAGTPDGAAIFSAQQVADATPEQVRSWLAEGYDRDLTLER